MTERNPVRTVTELEGMDSDDIVEGYQAGRQGDPEPGDNRSRAYWHGWRNGRVDGGHAAQDDAQRDLCRDVATRQQERRQ
ncbi:MAG TPA: hypothetical protein VGC15_14085 [Acetobacteraceae bacterium]